MPSKAPSGQQGTAARLAEFENRCRAIVEKSFDLICELDATRKIRYASPGVERILGYTEAELRGRAFESLLHPDDKETTRRWLQAGFRQRTQDSLSTRLRHRDGLWVALESAAQVFEDASGSARMVIVARDLSQKFLLEEELLQVRKLESLGILAGGIAHEFNNILTAILLNISTAAMDITPEDEKHLLLDQARKSCLQASELAEQLLTFSKRGIPVKKTTSIAQPAARDAKVVAADSEAAEPLHKSSGRVLVMDDDASIRSILLRMLTRMGYKADASKDGDEAVALYRKAIENGKRYAAVILDLTVPGGKGGREAIRELRNLDGRAKVIITSGYLEDPVLNNYRSYGFAGVLRKPFEIQEVSELLYKTIGNASGGSDSK